MKRARHESEVVLREVSIPKRKETRNLPMTTRGNSRNEDGRGTEDKQANVPDPKKRNSVKRNKNMEDPETRIVSWYSETT